MAFLASLHLDRQMCERKARQRLAVAPRILGSRCHQGDDAALGATAQRPDMKVPNSHVVERFELASDLVLQRRRERHVEELERRAAYQADPPLEDNQPSYDAGNRVEPPPTEEPSCEERDDGQAAGESVSDNVEERSAVIVVVIVLVLSIVVVNVEQEDACDR